MIPSFAEQIYCLLFPPKGVIPLKAKANINAIDARIHELEELAAGKALAGMNRRVWNPRDSKLLTEQIIQLRDSCDPPMSFKEVTTRLGDPISVEATRARYEEYKKSTQKAAVSVPEVVLPEIEIVDHIVEADEMIEISEEVVSDEPIHQEPITQDIPPERPDEAEEPLQQDDDIRVMSGCSMSSGCLADFIRSLKKKGLGAKTIAQEINECHGLNVTWQEVRARMVQIGKEQKRSAPKIAPATPKDAPAKKQYLDFNRIADSKILDMKKRGAMDFEIAQSLTRNPGGQWDAAKVADRYNQLKAEELA